MNEPTVGQLKKRLVSQAKRQEQLEAELQSALERSRETAMHAERLCEHFDRLVEDRDDLRIWIVTLMASNPDIVRKPLEQIIVKALLLADALNWPDLKEKLRQRVMQP